MTPPPAVLWRASTLHFLGDPAHSTLKKAYEFHEDGALLVQDGHILKAGAYSEVYPTAPEATIIKTLPGKMLMPGFIDTHVHYPQLGIMGACGHQLLEWLENYAFPEEGRFSDTDYARTTAHFFLDQLAAHGTTTALVFGTVKPASIDVFFEACIQKNRRMIAGKVMMDRYAPAYLLDTAASSYEDSKRLIERWHGRQRLTYAVTPRFAPTSTAEQLKAAGRLLQEHDDVLLHTHLAENRKEVEWVSALFPQCSSYLDVYDHFKLLSPRSVFAHSIHLSDKEWQSLASSHASIAFCPGSNLFIGSGLFNTEKAIQHGINTGLASDVGGGTSLCLLDAMKQAYQVSQLQGYTLSALSAFYMATLGGAKALHLDDRIGSFKTGNEADFIVLNPEATPLLKYRMASTQSLEERLGIMMMMGDDRLIEQTVIMGEVQ